MSQDVVVVGAGLSGMVAAVRLAEAGVRTAVLAQGVGATHLSPATIDVLGYTPDLVESPARALPSFRTEHPDHPYARLSDDVLSDSLSWLRELASELGYEGSVEENVLLPTAVGAAKPSALVPGAMAAGTLRPGGRFVFVGLRALKSFYPAYLAENLGQLKLPSGATVQARAVQLSDPVREADLTPLDYARRFEDPAFRDAIAKELGPQLEPDEAVGFPAVLGLDRHVEAWAALRDVLGHPVFEVPSLPPSVPGIRLFRALRARLRRAGGMLKLGPMVIGTEGGGGTLDAVLTHGAANRPGRHHARWFVAATGGFASGAIDLASHGELRETVFGLPVVGGPPEGTPRFLPGYFDDHPLARAGLAVDERLCPVDADGKPVFGNVLAVGATLAGAQPWKEHSGNGVAVATGYAAASAILEEAG